MKIEFKEDTHQYFIEGVEYPSVTTIIKDLNLIDTTWFKSEHATRGNHIHTICEFIDDGDLDYESVDDSYLGHIDAYKKFLVECNPTIESTEEIVCNTSYKYAGKLDRRGQLFNKDAIWDIKSGASHPTHGMQIAAYADTFGKRFKRYGLYLSKDGDYKLKEYSDRNDIKMFKGACALWWWKKNANL